MVKSGSDWRRGALGCTPKGSYNNNNNNKNNNNNHNNNNNNNNNNKQHTHTHTPARAFLRSVLSWGFLSRAKQKVLRRVLRRTLIVGFEREKGFQKGSLKGVSRRGFPEGTQKAEPRCFLEYDP